MSSFLYSWNPTRWEWQDQAQAIFDFNNGSKQYEMYWSCGNSKRIAIGDKFFLIKLGVAPKGIIGCGYVLSKPYDLLHWDKEKASQGKTTLRTDLLFLSLSEEPIMSLSILEVRYPNYNWTPRRNGISIPESISEELFSEIQGSNNFSFTPMADSDVASYVEGRSKRITIATYDRSPQARQDCKEKHGVNCSVCGFNFEKVYGEIGRNFIEVHHLHQIADAGGEHLVDPIKDLRPVCANCHRMLHKSRVVMPIEDLQTIFKKSSR